MAEQKSVVFDLSESLEYANTKTASKDKTAQVEMFAPTYETSKASYKLAQYFMRSVFNVRKLAADEDTEDSKKDEEFTLEAVKMIFFASEVLFDKVVDNFISIASEACFLDSEKKIPLSKHLISKISFDDLTNMVCFYVATFIVPFALSMK